MNALTAHLTLHCRRLFLRNYDIPVNIGVYDFEKVAPQRVVFNVDLYVPLAVSTPTQDDVSEIVDYDLIRRVINARVERGHIELQETLCDDIANTLMEHPKIAAVRVSTEKPDVYPNCDAVGVEVWRVREDT